MRAKLHLLTTQSTGKTGVAKQRDLLEFLASVEDDPENCVTAKAQETLVTVEQELIQLEVQAMRIPPRWLYQCSSIDMRTQRCSDPSPYADDIPMDEDGHFSPAPAVLRSNKTATIAIAPGTRCTVQSLAAFDAGQPGGKRKSQQIPTSKGVFSLAGLKGMRDPLLVAAVRCDDHLHYRKVAWQLRWER